MKNKKTQERITQNNVHNINQHITSQKKTSQNKIKNIKTIQINIKQHLKNNNITQNKQDTRTHYNIS